MITGVSNRAQPIALQELTLEQMNLDRKADFEGDTFDPFRIGNQGQHYNLQLQAQNAQLNKLNSQGGHIWSPEK